MMQLGCGVRSEDLILHADGALKGGKGELVEAHLRACPVCRRWMAEFEQSGRLLRAASPPIDDPAGRAAIRARIEREAQRRITPPRGVRPLLILAALALVIVAATLFSTPASQASSSVGRFFRFVERGSPRSVLDGGTTPVVRPTGEIMPMTAETLAALPFMSQHPAELPLGLRLAEGHIVRGTRLGLKYRNDRGLVLALTQERAQNVRYRLNTSGARLVMIGGVEVLWQPDPLPDTVAVLTWEDRGVLYSLSADELPEGPLRFDDARLIVEALLSER